jgi:hypothetical protein
VCEITLFECIWRYGRTRPEDSRETVVTKTTLDISRDATNRGFVTDNGTPRSGSSSGKASQSAQEQGLAPETAVPRIAGLSALKGIVLYGAVLTFASVYTYFIVRIFQAPAGKPPYLDTTLVSAAAALAGVLGSAFALEIGVPTARSATNADLREELKAAANGTSKDRLLATGRQIFSLEPASTDGASWPKTFGIWVYAIVASAVAVSYVVNQNQTPPSIKALAVAFGGYVIALVTAAYGITKGS